VAVGGYQVLLLSRVGSDSGETEAINVKGVEVRQFGGRSVAIATFTIDADALAIATDADIGSAQAMMASAMSAAASAAGVLPKAAGEINRAWRSGEPTLAVSIVTAQTVRTELAHPVELHPALISEAHAVIARGVRDQGIEPGTYVGDDAKRLDRDVLAPVALSLLMQRISRHRCREVVAYGMEQLERAIATRDQEARDLEQSARTMTLDWDPVDRLKEVQSEHLLLRRCLEVIVELALRDDPNGGTSLDQLAWMELLAAAQAYLEATSRSEAVHHQVRPTAIAITELYEISAVDPPSGTRSDEAAGSGRVYDLDLETYQRARAEYVMGPGDDATPGSTPAAGSEGSTPTTALPGVSAEVELGMVGAYGASATDVLRTLLALGQWPLADDEGDVAITSLDGIVAHVVARTVMGDEPEGEQRVRAALELLTSTSDELRDADWRPWHARSRQRRLLVQPLPAVADDFIVIAPHFCIRSASVYINYLRQGLLPWTQPPPPAELERALADLRDQRNRQLENDVAAALEAAGYVVEVRVRETDPQRLGVPSLTGEVDAVVCRPGSRVLWLIEVKDPADTYVVPEIRRHLDRFLVTRRKDVAYADQLAAKLADLAPFADQIAMALGLPPRVHGERYTVRPLFVTRRPVAAAYVGDQVPFTTLPQLIQTLQGWDS